MSQIEMLVTNKSSSFSFLNSGERYRKQRL